MQMKNFSTFHRNSFDSGKNKKKNKIPYDSVLFMQVVTVEYTHFSFIYTVLCSIYDILCMKNAFCAIEQLHNLNEENIYE